MIGSDRRANASRLPLVTAAGALASLLLAACGTPPAGAASAGAAPAPAASPTAIPTVAATPVVQSPPAGRNLIVNGDAEAGPGTDGETVAPNVPGWTRTGEFNAIAYDTNGSGNYPTPNDPGPPDRGRNFFAGGPNTDHSRAVQTIDVSDMGTALDSGRVSYTLSAWLGGYRGQDDQVQLAARFLSADGRLLATATLPTVLDSDRGGKTALLPRTTSGTVPASTRRIEVDMDMIRKAGNANDGYADDLSLVLTGAT
jgi:hypothetical protein